MQMKGKDCANNGILVPESLLELYGLKASEMETMQIMGYWFQGLL